MQYVLFALLLFGLSACGTTGSNTTAGNASGKLTANVVMAKSSAKSVALAPADSVTKLRLIVSGPAIPTAKKDFTGTPAPTSGTVEVYPGSNLTLTAQAFDASGAMIYEGFATGLTVVAGPTPTDAGTITMTPPVVKAEDTSCLSCHASTRDIAGQNLVASYKQSGHYTNDTVMNGKNGSTQPGCAGCHGTQHNDVAPSASGRCFECHGANLSLKHTSATALVAGDANPARYITIGGKNCSACHEPHNPINGAGKQERKDWAASGHGNINGLAWAHYDFTIRDTCNACHTPGGFIKAIGNNFTNTKATSTTVSSGKQPLTCDACHSSNDFKNSARALPAYKAGMGGFGASAKTFTQFPDVGASNLCIPCHAGREDGASLAAGNYNFTNKTFVNPHYLTAAATFYGTGGFQFYTSGVRYNKYGAAGKVGKNANWSHGRLGMDNYSASGSNDLAGVSNNTGNKGQCVACHLGPKNTHSFGAAEVANATIVGATNTSGGSALTRSCYGCHKGYANSTVPTIAGFIDEEKEIWNRMFDFYQWQLEQLGIYFTNTVNPYFFSDSAFTTALSNWTTQVPTGTPIKTMGAAMNLKMLVAERGSFVHNRAFGRALISDSIAYLQKGNAMEAYNEVKPNQNDLINFTNYSTARPTSYPGQIGPNVSITTLKSYLTRSATGGYTRR